MSLSCPVSARRWNVSPLPRLFRRCNIYFEVYMCTRGRIRVPKPAASQAVLDGMQLTLFMWLAEHLTVVRAWCKQMPARSVKSRRALYQHFRGARVHDHTTSAVHDSRYPPPDPGNRSNMQYHVLFVLSPSPTVTASAMITFTGRDASASYLAHNLQPFVTAILAQDSTADVHRLVPGEGGALAVLLAWLSSHAPGQATSHSSSGQIDVNPSGTALSPVVGTKHLELESNCMCNGMQYYIKRSPLKSCTSIIGGQISRVG